MERHLLKILSHHILVSVSQHEDMIQGNPGTFEGNRKPAWQQLRHGSNSNMSGWTIITPHLDTGPNREQVFGPISALYLSACAEGIVCVYAHMFAGVDKERMCTCVLVSVCGLSLSLSWLALSSPCWTFLTSLTI